MTEQGWEPFDRISQYAIYDLRKQIARLNQIIEQQKERLAHYEQCADSPLMRTMLERVERLRRVVEQAEVLAEEVRADWKIGESGIREAIGDANYVITRTLINSVVAALALLQPGDLEPADLEETR